MIDGHSLFLLPTMHKNEAGTGRGDPDTLVSANNLVASLSGQGKEVEVEEVLEVTLAACQACAW